MVALLTCNKMIVGTSCGGDGCCSERWWFIYRLSSVAHDVCTMAVDGCSLCLHNKILA